MLEPAPPTPKDSMSPHTSCYALTSLNSPSPALSGPRAFVSSFEIIVTKKLKLCVIEYQAFSHRTIMSSRRSASYRALPALISSLPYFMPQRLGLLFALLEIKPRDQHLLGKCSTSEPHPQRRGWSESQAFNDFTPTELSVNQQSSYFPMPKHNSHPRLRN